MKNPRINGQSKKRTVVQPDEYFSCGPFEMARFGNFAIGRSNMSKEQFEAMQGKLVERFPAVCRDIDDKIFRIAEIVKKLPPSEPHIQGASATAATSMGVL